MPTANPIAARVDTKCYAMSGHWHLEVKLVSRLLVLFRALPIAVGRALGKSKRLGPGAPRNECVKNCFRILMRKGHAYAQRSMGFEPNGRLSNRSRL